MHRCQPREGLAFDYRYVWLRDQVATAAEHDRLDDDAHLAIGLLVDDIGEIWQTPDAGIWELEARWWTHSRLAVVAGLRSAAGVAPAAVGPRWAALADAVLAETSSRCLDEQGAWQRAQGLPGPDAALLLPPVRGALPAGDPRTRATLATVTDQLADDGYLYRFRPGEGELGADQGAFVLCGFVMALARWHQGEQVEAVRWFERNRAACGPPGLYAEEYDVQQRQLRGNLPQAFVHATMLETAARLAGASSRTARDDA